MTPAGWLALGVMISLLFSGGWAAIVYAAAARRTPRPTGAQMAYIVLLSAGVAFGGAFYIIHTVLSALRLLT